MRLVKEQGGGEEEGTKCSQTNLGILKTAELACHA